jgi:hypothetical protein
MLENLSHYHQSCVLQWVASELYKGTGVAPASTAAICHRQHNRLRRVKEKESPQNYDIHTQTKT